MAEEETRRIDLSNSEQSSQVAYVDDPREDGETGSQEQPVAYVSLGLTVGDGFKFGCGFAMAMAIATLIIVLLASLVFLVASLMGVPVPVGAT